jgi:uncharacterized protein YdeI (YjbR/CyaY-like superfamily)
MNVNAVLNFKSAHEWRQWLESNHDKEKEAYLILNKKGSKLAGLCYEEALEEALSFGWIDGKLKSVDADTFMLRFSPRKARSMWSRKNKDKAEELIARGMMTEAGLARIEEAKKNGSWDAAYTNKIKDEIPTELEKALKQNLIAWTNFKNLANTYQNMYIGWINSAKTAATREKRIAEVVKRSALNQKPGVG